MLGETWPRLHVLFSIGKAAFSSAGSHFPSKAWPPLIRQRPRLVAIVIGCGSDRSDRVQFRFRQCRS